MLDPSAKSVDVIGMELKAHLIEGRPFGTTTVLTIPEVGGTIWVRRDDGDLVRDYEVLGGRNGAVHVGPTRTQTNLTPSEIIP
jgi:hypothetical protein